MGKNTVYIIYGVVTSKLLLSYVGVMLKINALVYSQFRQIYFHNVEFGMRDNGHM